MNQVKAGYVDNGVELFWLDAAEPEQQDGPPAGSAWSVGSMQRVGMMFPYYHTQTCALAPTRTRSALVPLSRCGPDEWIPLCGIWIPLSGIWIPARPTDSLYVLPIPADQIPNPWDADADGLKSAGLTDSLVLSRSAWAGVQKHSAVLWNGDTRSTFDFLTTAIAAMQNIQMSGIAWWTTDIGGDGSGVRTMTDPGSRAHQPSSALINPHQPASTRISAHQRFINVHQLASTLISTHQHSSTLINALTPPLPPSQDMEEATLQTVHFASSSFAGSSLE